MKNRFISIISILLTLCLLLSGCAGASTSQTNKNPGQTNNGYISESSDSSHDNSELPNYTESTTISLASIPAYSGNPYVTLNGGTPDFSSSELKTQSYEYYSELDKLGRCGVVHACVGRDIMPTEERGSIGMVKPTGWHTVKYDCVDGKYLYNRCHLIGYQLTGENANEQNLITGTRYMNVDGMLPLENIVADYVKETSNHVMYRVTPLYKGNNLLANGVQMEAYSVEDDGDGICFNVFVYNVQPQITIDYATGESHLSNSSSTVTPEKDTQKKEATYILNKNTKKIHLPSCYSVDQMKESNKKYYTGDIEDLIDQGYSRCKNCNP